MRYLKFFNWVKFVGISGSVAAGFAKEDDDIDIFVVVKNYTSWMYRGLIVFRNIFHHKIRTKLDGKRVKDKFCLNLICEERDVMFDEDVFNFHELVYLIPIFNERYLNYIYSQNIWLRETYGVKGELLMSKVIGSKKGGLLFKVINFIFFIAEVCFMFLTFHKPEWNRLWSNYKRGRIEFFPWEFKKEIIESQTS
jgi:predicted nucleotidyltransferase